MYGERAARRVPMLIGGDTLYDGDPGRERGSGGRAAEDLNGAVHNVARGRREIDARSGGAGGVDSYRPGQDKNRRRDIVDGDAEARRAREPGRIDGGACQTRRAERECRPGWTIARRDQGVASTVDSGRGVNDNSSDRVGSLDRQVDGRRDGRRRWGASSGEVKQLGGGEVRSAIGAPRYESLAIQ